MQQFNLSVQYVFNITQKTLDLHWSGFCKTKRKMSIKVGDIVEVIIDKWRLYGLHQVKIKNAAEYNGLLITSCNISMRPRKIYYTGLNVRARIVRIDNYFVDLIPVF